jgi:hypothetical protein
MRLRSILFFVLFSLASAAAFAQQPSQIESRFIGTMDSAMKIGAARNAEFNARIVEINQARPLELQNLNREIVDSNASRIFQFVDFLKQFQSDGRARAARFEDSLFVISNDYPPVKRRQQILNFSSAFKADQEAFDSHLSNLITVYSSVLDVLIFLKQADYEIANTQLKFKTKADVKRYNELMSSVDAAQALLPKSIAKAKKATAAMNETIDALNGVKKTNKKGAKQ